MDAKDQSVTCVCMQPSRRSGRARGLAGEPRRCRPAAITTAFSLNPSHRYEVFTFSRPAHVLSAMMLPFARWQQQEFGKQSTERVRRAVVAAAAATGGKQKEEKTS